MHKIFKEQAIEDIISSRIKLAKHDIKSPSKETIEKELNLNGLGSIKTLFQGIIDSYSKMSHILPKVNVPDDLSDLKGVGANDTFIANKSIAHLHNHLINLAQSNQFDLNDWLRRIKADNVSESERGFGIVEDLHGGVLQMINNAYNAAKVSADSICIIILKLRKKIKDLDTLGDFTNAYHELDKYSRLLREHVAIIGIAHQIDHLVMDIKQQMDMCTSTSFSYRVAKLISDDSDELNTNLRRQFL